VDTRNPHSRHAAGKKWPKSCSRVRQEKRGYIRYAKKIQRSTLCRRCNLQGRKGGLVNGDKGQEHSRLIRGRLTCLYFRRQRHGEGRTYGEAKPGREVDRKGWVAHTGKWGALTRKSIGNYRLGLRVRRKQEQKIGQGARTGRVSGRKRKKAISWNGLTVKASPQG